MSDSELAKRRLKRERAARGEAERLLEQKSLELYESGLKLRESEARLRTIVNTVAIGIITIDIHGSIESINAPGASIFGYAEIELVGKNINSLLPELDCCQLDLHAQANVDTDCHEIISKEIGLVGHRADEKSISLEIAVSKGHLEEKPFFTIIVRDVTERKALEGQLLQARKLESIGQIAAGIAHEINTPAQFVGDNTRFLRDAFADLAALVKAYSSLYNAIRKDSVLPNDVEAVATAIEVADADYLAEEIPSAIEQSLDGITRISKIVLAMKEFSHPGGDDKEFIDLNKNIANTIIVASNEWKYVAELSTEYDEQLPPVPCHPQEISQVILNLVVNAAHAIEEKNGEGDADKGRISVSTRLCSDAAEIRVVDNGCGIPEDIRSRIFDPFFTTKEVGKGTGQGLSIAYSTVVDKHNGTIKVESDTESETTFVVRLPLVASNSEGIVEAA